ncbi:hypothetical protein [Parapedobacter tibetensis]|uniref:hypothetical protein n=1 Tax=Parapedobacter tibetensis TaxID=2972951 RepID=UPI0021524E98|nr:hypothetical protein [Parapedobacter tibetensis]
MKESAAYVHPKPTLEGMEAAYADYQPKAVEAAMGGRVYTTAERESKRRPAGLSVVVGA